MWLRIVLLAALLCCARTVAAAEVRIDDIKPINHTEAWVQTQIELGLEADVQQFCRTDATSCDPIRPRFLRALIVRYLQGPSGQIGGIHFRNGLVCEAKGQFGSCEAAEPPDGRACDPLNPGYGDCFEALDLRDLRIGGALDLKGTTFRGDIWLGGAQFEQVLNLDETTIWGDIDAHRLHVNAGLTMFGSMVIGNFKADGMISGGTVNLFQSWVMGQLYMRGTRTEGDLDLGRLRIIPRFPDVGDEAGGRPRDSVGTPRKWLDLSNAGIGGNLLMTGIQVPTQGADLGGAGVGGSVWIENDSRFDGVLTMERSHIAGSLMLGRGSFTQIDLAAARVDREMRLESGGQPTQWVPAQGKPTRLNLRNARIGVLRDTVMSWPECVTLAGFAYDQPPHDYAVDKIPELRGDPYRGCPDVQQHGAASAQDSGAAAPGWLRSSWLCESDWLSPWLGCSRRPSGETTERRSVTWWLNWIERDPDHTEQTYAQLALALGNAGEGDAADAIQFAQRVWERSKGNPWSPAVWLSVLEQILVGFGIGTYALMTAFWTVVAAGYAAHRLRVRLRVLEKSQCVIGDRGTAWCAAASLLTILPLVPMPKSMGDFLHAPILPDRPDTQPLRGTLLLGFTGLTLMGFVLSGFLLHGFSRLAGL